MRPWLTALSFIVLLFASWTYYHLNSSSQAGVFPTNPPTPYRHYNPTAPAHGRILAIHGLDASKEVMNIVSLALADAGFEVYSIDLPGHGDSLGRFDGLRAKDVVEQVLDQLGPNIPVLGHSFGGGVLLELAAERDFDTMLLFSPGPRAVDHIRANRVLVVSGQFDIPRVSEFVKILSNANADILVSRTVSWSGHTGYMFRTDVQREVVEWLGGNPSGLRTSRRLALLVGMIASSISLGVGLLLGRQSLTNLGMSDLPPRASSAILLPYVAASVAAYSLSAGVVLMSWLHLFASDYLISFVLAAGVFVCLQRPPITIAKAPLTRALAAAVYLITVPGLIVLSQLAHLNLSGGRWWRFLAITAASLPLFVADETLIRPIRPWWKSTGMMLLTRVVLAGFIGTGVLTLNRSSGFLVLVLHLVLAFWMLLWLAGGVVRRNTQNSLATALFCALIQGWVFAAIFITT